MMKWPTTFSRPLSTLLAIIAMIGSFSYPSSAMPTLHLQARGTIGGILICTGPNRSGNCTYGVYEMETCYNLPTPFFRNATTFAPDEGGWYCYPYM